MSYYLWPHGDEQRLRHYLEKGRVDLRVDTPFQDEMDGGDVAYFYVTNKVGLVAFATLAGRPYQMPAGEVRNPAFPLAVSLRGIHYISPPIRCQGKRGKFQWVTRLSTPLQMLGEITID